MISYTIFEVFTKTNQKYLLCMIEMPGHGFRVHNDGGSKSLLHKGASLATDLPG